jgi:hypothetical protein
MAMSPAASYPGDAVPIVDRLTSVPDLAQVAALFRPEFLVEVDAVVAAGG